MIDEMVSRLGDEVEKLWKRDEGGTGKYPPTSLHVGCNNMISQSLQSWGEGRGLLAQAWEKTRSINE